MGQVGPAVATANLFPEGLKRGRQSRDELDFELIPGVVNSIRGPFGIEGPEHLVAEVVGRVELVTSGVEEVDDVIVDQSCDLG
ncbi:hypothetical protein AM609_02690 [Actinomyces sp. oral taxon 414]|nr:hypothetical protein AM609_02690 [Actinomyces sp. oral taxon 414]